MARGEFYSSEPTQDEYLASLPRACSSASRTVFSFSTYLPMHKSVTSPIEAQILDYHRVWKNCLEVECSKGQATGLQCKLSGNNTNYPAAKEPWSCMS